MSIGKTHISIYSSLPSGGALELAKLNIAFLAKKAKIKQLSDNLIKPTNFINYMYLAILKIPKIHKNLAKQINHHNEVLLAYHSWITKSPHLLRYVIQKKVYICHDVMREYYDPEHIKIQNLKERVINILRLPLRYIDRKNLHSSDLTVVANSKFSKSLIDKCYSVSAKVLYPGIDVSSFRSSKKVRKVNQVISVGAINKLKRYEFLIRVISEVDLKVRPKLVLIGNGKNLNYSLHLKKLASQLNVNLNVKINLDKTSLVEEYLKSKVFVYAPVNEPFGIVVQEAMATHLPLFVYKYGGGYAEILTRENGVLLENLDPKEWGIRLTSLLNNQKQIDKYGKYNYKYVSEKYSAKTMNRNLLKIINNI